MTTPALRDFMNRNYPAAFGLAALAAVLDARVNGAPLDPALAARVSELLTALGADAVLDDVAPQDAAACLLEIRQMLALNAKLLYPETRASSWSYDDPRLLQQIGDFSRGFAMGLTRGIIPALEGLPARFATPTATFLDVGVGVAALSLAMAEQWPALRIVGTDVFAPALALARANVDQAKLGDRITLREQSVEHLPDDSAFDLAWLPILFVGEAIVPRALDNIRGALRPGGWLTIAIPDTSAMDPINAAQWRLRITTFGGPTWPPAEIATRLRDHGFVDVRILPGPPGSPMVTIVGRRAPA